MPAVVIPGLLSWLLIPLSLPFVRCGRANAKSRLAQYSATEVCLPSETSTEYCACPPASQFADLLFFAGFDFQPPIW
jgi:hypothetical protein